MNGTDSLKRVVSLILFLSFLLVPREIMGSESPADPTPEADPVALAEFLTYADLAVRALAEEPPPGKQKTEESRIRRYDQFFIDSYAVRALAVAYDLTGRKTYWEACRSWTGRMIRYQEKMIPPGAYYMAYHRKPGESDGQWFVADCGSIAMGVLATALRAGNEPERKQCLESARDYARLVMDNFIRPNGGITDGFWKKSDKEWWCSSALFAASAFQLYGITGELKYKEVAMNAVDWLLGFQYDGTILYSFETGAPTTIFYILEAYAAALPYLEAGGQRQKEVFRRFSQTVNWIIRNQTADGWWDYNPDNWGVKLNGFPMHLLIYLRHAQDTGFRRHEFISPGGRLVSFEALVQSGTARAFEYLKTHGPRKDVFTQQAAFAMMSYAEKLCPVELYHKKSTDFPYKRYSEQEIKRLLEKYKLKGKE